MRGYKKYRPIFKIKSYNQTSGGYIYDIVNQGYPAFAINYINWDGEGVVIISVEKRPFIEFPK